VGPAIAGPFCFVRRYNVAMLYKYHPGTTPLVVNVPHAGTVVSPELAQRLTPHAQTLPDTDWHVDRLVEFARERGASLLVAQVSRFHVDLNRGRDDRPLYAGATTGLVPVQTFSGEAVYLSEPPGDDEIAERVRQYWDPYHSRLETLLNEVRERHGHAVLLDAHSIRSRIPRLFDGQLPDLNLGTWEGRSCAPALREKVSRIIASAPGLTSVVDGRFKGGYNTRNYGRPEEGVHALQIEIAQRSYMHEDDPQLWDEDRAGPVIKVLEQIVECLQNWSP